jgi:hypothetical protein
VILDLLVAMLAQLLTDAVSILPTVAHWTPGIGALTSFVGFIRGTDDYLPVTETIACFGIALAVGKAQLLWAGAIWTYRRIRG